MIKTYKTYEVVTVTSVSIDIDEMCEMIKEAVKEMLLDHYNIVSEDHPQLMPDLIKEISKRLLATENDTYKAAILAYLAEVNAPKSIKELQTEVAALAGLTNQRVTYILTDLVKAGSLTKMYVKKTPFYSIAA